MAESQARNPYFWSAGLLLIILSPVLALLFLSGLIIGLCWVSLSVGYIVAIEGTMTKKALGK